MDYVDRYYAEMKRKGAEVVKRVESGQTWKEIARNMGYGIGTVKKYFYEYGKNACPCCHRDFDTGELVAIKPRKAERDEEIYRKRRAGAKFKDLAREFKLHPSTLSSICATKRIEDIGLDEYFKERGLR
jgi:DNA-binding CsgD family transcriptional regulator